jgi:lipopolysaccharide exporter
MPEDFGLMAMASSVVALIELIRLFGFDTALINNQNAGRDEYDTAWTMSIIFSITAAILVISFSGFAADYYRDERLDTLLDVMALSFLISGFSNIGAVEFRKQLNFHKEFQYQVISKFIGFLATMVLAWYFRNYWALSLGTLVNNCIALILSYRMQSYRPKITMIAWKKLLGFSSWLMLNNILVFLSHNVHNFIAGRLIGSSGLGFYSVGGEIGSIVSMEIVSPINRAAYPGYAKVADDLQELSRTYINLLAYIALLVFPCALGIFSISPIMVTVLLGSGWEDSVIYIQIFTISSIFVALSGNASYIFIVLNKQYVNTVSRVVNILVFLISSYILSPKMGGVGVALAMFLSTFMDFFISVFVVNYFLKINIQTIVYKLFRPLFSALVMSFIVIYAIFLQMLSMSVLGLISSILLGAIVFIVFILLLCALAGWSKTIEVQLLKKTFNKNLNQIA